MGSHVVVFKREVRGPTMFQASRLKFLAILLFASHAIAASVSSSDSASSGHSHGFDGSSDTNLKTGSIEFSHSSDFGASSNSFRERTDPVEIVVADLDDIDSTVETVQEGSASSGQENEASSHGFDGSSDTNLKTGAFEFSHSSDFGASSN